MRKLIHILILLLIAGALALAPYRLFIGPIGNLLARGGGTDAVSSASVILDAPSGEFVVLLNEKRHQKYQSAEDWTRFFQGESLVIMDDVACLVAEGDAAAIDMAESYRSRLPENQMKLSREDGLMMISRAQAGGFDAMVMSREFARAYGAETVRSVPGVRVIEIGGDGP